MSAGGAGAPEVAPPEIDVALPDKPATEKRYDPEPGRDRVRGYLASGLVIIARGNCRRGVDHPVAAPRHGI